ncbi:MAG: zinc ribbon domain-containing protein [Deltaproteobacteria bacterium]|nr:zinc ribbon domain-containing protein [Deltaproteobacteria bacterium]
MPIYEYQCVACGQVLEQWQKISDDPLQVCPQCGGSMHKLVSCCSFQLKGSGWYQSDYSGKMQTDNMSGASKAPENAASATDNGGGKDAGATPQTEKSPKPETETKTSSPGKIE